MSRPAPARRAYPPSLGEARYLS
ncbi:gamma-glutamylcyclotransferase, partial [Burkholderia pseudomallei OB]|nr:gamma-glutamylcyclotransferase [Burkholderia pseudomallei OB]